jgi:hypothetical protein
MPKWTYMTKQTDITHTMRSILVDWLVEVGEEYKLQTETLFLAVSYIDRYYSTKLSRFNDKTKFRTVIFKTDVMASEVTYGIIPVPYCSASLHTLHIYYFLQATDNSLLIFRGNIFSLAVIIVFS